MSLSKSEQEVIISFSADDARAEVYISNPIYIRRLEKLASKYPGAYKQTSVTHSEKDKSIISACYECPINLIRFGSPREYTEEQRQAMSERGKLLKNSR